MTVGALCVAAEARATCDEGASFVRVTASEPVPAGERTRALVDSLVPHLRAELHARGIGVCAESEPASSSPIALIVFQYVGVVDDAKLSITIVDRVTDKSVVRVLDLSTLPVDTRLLAVAASVDELLRASWLETLLAPRTPPPTPVQRAVVSSLPPVPVAVAKPLPRRIHGELGVDTVATLVLGLRSAFGGDVHAAYWPTSRWGLLARAGGSGGLAEESVNGTVASDLLRAGAGVAFALVPVHEKIGVRAEVRVDAGRVTFRGAPDERGTLRSSTALFTATSSLGVRTWLDLAHGAAGSLRGFVGVAGSLALLPAVGTDRTVSGTELEVSGISGFGFDAALGAAWAF